ncbi:acetamidase/formamidase family protein [Aquibacillus sediminis]|uniref:acetamidase/formamidase family protein n=1 Tax=Aquibacillus sediminis TaxID=2574734 RepID=UPI001FE25B2C|nr:acetamidase/formamidase family protein [Aquibacillus sediminis]
MKKRGRIPVKVKRFGVVLASFTILATIPLHTVAATADLPILQSTITEEVEGEHYVPSAVENITWGYLPNRDNEPVKRISSGTTVTFDTVSHEGILEDQGRNPVEYFSQYGISEDQVLDDAKAIAESDLDHDFFDDGPHVVTGPVAIDGAEPGDVLKVEVLSLEPRVPYGVISNRHYKGALPGEFPESDEPHPDASAENPDLYHNVSKFTPIEEINEKLYGVLPTETGNDVRFPLRPFMGLMGVAANTSDPVNSVPPIETGGNIDINELGVGSTLYLPIEVADALFFTGDPHFAQGDGEVALTAWEASLRATFRLTVLKEGDPAIPRDGAFTQPFAETEDYWIPIGLDVDLDEAMKESVRESVSFLEEKLGMERDTALAYLSAATDYEVSQVVDKTKGIHALIDKKHFIDNLNLAVNVDGSTIDSKIVDDDYYVPLRALIEQLGGEIEWDSNKNGAVASIDGKSIVAPIKSNFYTIDGVEVYHEGYSILQDGSTLIPIKSIPDILGAKVNWTTSGNTLQAQITYDLKK